MGINVVIASTPANLGNNKEEKKHCTRVFVVEWWTVIDFRTCLSFLECTIACRSTCFHFPSCAPLLGEGLAGWVEVGGGCFVSWARALSCHTTHLYCSGRESFVPPGTKPALIKNNSIAQCIENGPHYYYRLEVKFSQGLPVGGRKNVFKFSSCFPLNQRFHVFKKCLYMLKSVIQWPCSPNCPVLYLSALWYPVCDVIANQIQGLVLISLYSIALNMGGRLCRIQSTLEENASLEKMMLSGGDEERKKT